MAPRESDELVGLDSAMKITRVRTHVLSLLLPRPVKTAVHHISTVDTVLTEMETDGGRWGWATASHSGPVGRGRSSLS